MGSSLAGLPGFHADSVRNLDAWSRPNTSASGDNRYSLLRRAPSFSQPQPGSNGDESARYFLHLAPTNNLDLSLSKVIPIGKTVKMEVRLDAFNALNHASSPA